MPQNSTPSNPQPEKQPGADARAARVSGAEQSWGGVVDRRVMPDRRNVRVEGQPAPTGLERRRGAGRRLSDHVRSAEEGELTKEQFLFLMAVNEFKRANQVMFPTWSDVLEVVRLLGYRKTQPMAVKLNNAEDWSEPGDAPANVRTDRQLMRQKAAEAAAKAARQAERDAA